MDVVVDKKLVLIHPKRRNKSELIISPSYNYSPLIHEGRLRGTKKILKALTNKKFYLHPPFKSFCFPCMASVLRWTKERKNCYVLVIIRGLFVWYGSR
jgi:hypothetical protein